MTKKKRRTKSEPYEPNETHRELVETLSRIGWPQAKIAKTLTLRLSTLRESYKKELEMAHAELLSEASRTLMFAVKLRGDNIDTAVRTAMFIAKTRAGWRERDKKKDKETDKSVTERVVLELKMPDGSSSI